MDSNLGQLERLLKEGANFTFANFSLRGDFSGPMYGGEDSPDWLVWKTRVCNAIQELVGQNSPPLALLKRAMEIKTAHFAEDAFVQQKTLVISAIEQTVKIVQDDVFGESKLQKSVSSSGALSNRVFVVHGHDHGVKTDLEVFLTNIGLEPVVLHRQPDQGRTLIEKFEHHSDVGFAFILLTPDDVAYKATEDILPDASRKKESRSRPNVIFEFGYFVGRLGRRRVCCLIKGDVAKPSDIDGLVYKPFSESIEAIGFSIIKELKSAGYTIKI
jgi:predicted nucleotide-binding protein